MQPTWVDHTGNDSFESVTVTGAAIYVGGHQRWVNNSFGSDSSGRRCAVPRPGIVALDPSNGLPFSWNPGRNPRGAGAYALFATPNGLYVGSDTTYIGDHKYYRGRIAYFPLAGGKAVPSVATASLPGNVYLAGSCPDERRTNVLYRIDAGRSDDPGRRTTVPTGPLTPATRARTATAATTPRAGSTVNALNATVPATTPSGIFSTERWDPGSKNDGQRDAVDLPGRRQHPDRGPALLRQPLQRHVTGRSAGLRRRRSTASACSTTTTSWPTPATRPAR